MKTLQALFLAGVLSFFGCTNSGRTTSATSGADSAATADQTVAAKPKILFVLTSHDQKGNTGEKTGFFLSEAAHPWESLKDDYEIDFVSPKGGKAPVDGFDLKDPVNKAFWDDTAVQQKISNTLKPSEINPEDYVAIHYVGGHGAMWDFPGNEELNGIAARIYEKNGIVSAVCHGPAGIVDIKLSDGSYLIKGKKVAGFSNEEEEAVKATKVVPFLLEDKLKERGGLYESTPKFTEKVVVDDRLITGQNPQSAMLLGKEIHQALQTR